MRHERHFTLEQARASRGWVRERLEAMREARDGLGDAEARAALTEAAPTNGGGEPGRRVGKGFVALRSELATLQAAGIVLRDLDRGLVDFPAIVDGHEIYLCWVEAEEDDITAWHELDDGYGGRRALG